jgi:hypothetical protein
MLADGLVAAWSREFQEPLPQRVENLTWSRCLDEMLWSRCLINADYLRDEFRAVSDFDVLDASFDIRRGFFRIQKGADAAIVLRTSELDRSLCAALAEVTNRPPKTFFSKNIGSQKDYARLYQDVIKRALNLLLLVNWPTLFTCDTHI